MKTQYFKCTLKTDIVINASLATEGNMTTLDYIPGSNFLGIVAGKLYDDSTLTNKDHFDIFHSDKVSFGDALISQNNKISYVIPLSIFQDKLNKGLGEENKNSWVHHLLGINDNVRPKNEKDELIQLKQQRGGFLNSEKMFIKKVEKQFSLKSAHNREERRSTEGKMFGFESIKKGQEFIFSLLFEDVKYVDLVSETLVGNKRLGKSKTAQFGQVIIEKIESPEPFISKETLSNQLVIYAESNLCFLNDFGQSTYQPNPTDFGLEGIDEKSIDWDLSQIRTYSYSPWNTHRNTTNTQRNTIAKGSVIIINLNGEIDIKTLKTQVGEYAAEGLGRVIYNPEFLEADKQGFWKFGLKEVIKDKESIAVKLEDVKTVTSIGNFLHKKLKNEFNELKIGKSVINVMDQNKVLTHKDITPSQWGAIRTKATNAPNIQFLKEDLFADKTGYLTHGVAAERVWDKNRGSRREALETVINSNIELGTNFVARLAADMAKLNKGKR